MGFSIGVKKSLRVLGKGLGEQPFCKRVFPKKPFIMLLYKYSTYVCSAFVFIGYQIIDNSRK